MEQENLNILNTIKRIEVSNLLYSKIVKRIEMSKKNIIPLYKVGIAASLVVGLMVSQLIILNNFSKNKKHSNQTVELVKLNNNLLYNE